ncbi:cell wall-binding repeat-containing protein [Halobacillus sp. Nhm2S1]|uniref:cell wall-binding repeat-containing protein n=1 Tax=Halobacillus sp. Nhm2S1 TaxID=2866716 RepID=UPI001C7320AC|nr:cell wall-binding repeat-containing protein [Halobacillus sp. Nhm2S1]MBX0357666.1 cell wall-binding repeat-containing protein [Halobacillus sp. Nhm2S1]
MKNLLKVVVTMFFLSSLSMFLDPFYVLAEKEPKKIQSFQHEEDQFRSQFKPKKVTSQSKKPIPLDQIYDRQIVIKKKDAGVTLKLHKYEVVDNDVLEKLAPGMWMTVRIPESLDYEEELITIDEFPGVESASPDQIYQPSYLPSDPYYRSQQDYLKEIDMERAWEITQGTSQVKVAVIDSGVTPSHEDLTSRLTDGFDGILSGPVRSDEVGHGTHVTGIIAANANTKGVIGVSPKVKVEPIKVGTSDGLSTTAIIRGVQYAIDRNVDVINMSFGGYTPDPLLQDVLWQAYQEGIVLVAASGNDDTSAFSFPAGYPWVIAVGATDTTRSSTTAAGFSNYGLHIDVAAPGVGIVSTDRFGSYGSGDGTSFSAPIVSGLAALLKSKHPGWNPDQVEFALQNGAEQLYGQESHPYVGFGQVNGYQSLTTTLSDMGPDTSTWSVDGAKKISAGTYYEKFNFPNDNDLYAFTMKYPGELSINLSHGEKHMDPVMNVYQEVDGVIYELYSIDSRYEGEPETLSFYADRGKYYISVRDYYANWSKTAYELEVKQKLDQPARIYGKNRYETAVEISREGFRNGTNTIVLAQGQDFPDALSGAPLAYELDAPILLTRSKTLSEETKNEIERLGANKAYILGGNGAIDADVEMELKQMGLQVKRISGENRYQTSAEIAKELLSLQGRSSFDKALVSYGHNFPDALASAPYAAQEGYPILLTRPQALPEEIRPIAKGVNQAFVVGGESVVSDRILTDLPNGVRFSGSNRYATAVEIMEGLDMNTDEVFVVTGQSFADALTGSVLAASRQQPILLVRTNQIPGEMEAFIDRHQPQAYTILGGFGAVNEEVGAHLLQLSLE